MAISTSLPPIPDRNHSVAPSSRAASAPAHRVRRVRSSLVFSQDPGYKYVRSLNSRRPRELAPCRHPSLVCASRRFPNRLPTVVNSSDSESSLVLGHSGKPVNSLSSFPPFTHSHIAILDLTHIQWYSCTIRVHRPPSAMHARRYADCPRRYRTTPISHHPT